MSVGSELGKALDPEATWNTTECVCGHTVRVPSALRGREGTCPKCDRPFVTAGEPTKSPRGSGVFESEHPEREIKRLLHEPSFASRESEYTAAQRQAVIPGAVYLWVTLIIAQVLLGNSNSVRATLGMADSPPWLLPAWLLSLWLLAATCTATAAVAFQRIAAKSYSQETVGFAAAGGYDVARWVPLLCHVVLYGVYANTLDPSRPDPLAVLRGPWAFLAIGAGVAHIATWQVARRVFRSRFTKSLTEIAHWR